ncbi:hypothetical protein WGT02_23200 (plasmid) [Rhizobium sp. T1470]|uniref:hypothetical protein n=1 Tax=unclassified Rhizobium TaxID=2613769 RepID=UPI001AAFC3C6|nr:hypothetical protein [Rhizobium sp. T1473]MCA0804548.1 hypothetical protein [Rhizobium sp. T1473]
MIFDGGVIGHAGYPDKLRDAAYDIRANAKSGPVEFVDTTISFLMPENPPRAGRSAFLD